MIAGPKLATERFGVLISEQRSDGRRRGRGPLASELSDHFGRDGVFGDRTAAGAEHGALPRPVRGRFEGPGALQQAVVEGQHLIAAGSSRTRVSAPAYRSGLDQPKNPPYPPPRWNPSSCNAG